MEDRFFKWIYLQIILNEKTKRNLKKVPVHILVKLFEWINAVSHDGLLEIRKQPGYHDEPLKGRRKGQRSIRLSKSYKQYTKLLKMAK